MFGVILMCLCCRGNIRRYFRWLKFRLTPGHCSASDENREQAVEESSETVPETEMASQFGVSCHCRPNALIDTQ